MQSREINIHRVFFQITTLLIIAFILISCEPFTNTASMATGQSTQTMVQPPPAHPGIYQSNLLNPLDAPRAYLEDTCKYLRNKWNPSNAQPGSVVMIIMIRTVYKGLEKEPGGINVNDLPKLMEHLHEQGFRAINTKQFMAFMERNIKIPPRSALIIQDDNHQAENFDKNFRTYWASWGWPVVNGWVSQPDVPEALWQENIALENEGWVDHQAQGVLAGTYLTDDSSKAIIARELEGSLKAFAERYGKTPVAFIWPGGGFGLRPVQAARQLGYRLGFTSNSRGPVMYNWVPLASEVDPNRPSLIPEAGINDPLMTLPRYSPYEALDAIDRVRIMGNEAATYAQTNKAAEYEYYNAVCASTYGPIPSPQ